MRDPARVLCRLARWAYRRQLVEGTGGNFSCRLADGDILCTPTQTCKGWLTPDDLCVVAPDGHQRSGARPPSSELAMHLEIYAASPTTGAVFHCHPPYATTLAVLGETLPEGLLPEGDVFLGPVPLIPYQRPGTREMGRVLLPFVPDHTAALLQNHGTVVWAGNLDQAYLLTETLEAVCRVYYQARLIGTPLRIPDAERAALARQRSRP